MAENKKDSFTFSDKIKNSKPAFNPFSKRASSKIGNNGKPKKTLFERTRRDAPFFIAALAALLMLPFLYKYSGNVSDGGALVAPGMSDSVFDPERFDFSPSTEDASGQISQLTGRDPLSLIKGWGSSEEESTRYDYDGEDRDGFGAYSANDKNTSHSTSVSTYRRRAPAATRAAFKRTPTKINELRGAGLNTRGGGGPGSRFGGGLKTAAKKDSSGPLRQPTKPVSLQPLRAAGSPSRSYYGQDGVAQARASRDAMSKGDAKIALKDAMFEPVKGGRAGGLADGILAAGGGAGKMQRNMDFKGITPWWWDMMKQREQDKWKWKYFLWRKNLLEPLIKDVLAVGLTHLLNCLLWGNADADIDYFLGGAPGESKEGQCNGIKSSKWDAAVADAKANHQNFPFGGFPSSEDNCRRAFGLASNVKVKYEKGSSVVGGKGFWGARKTCLGGVIKGASVREESDCNRLADNHSFIVRKEGKAKNWKYVYHAVVVADNIDGKPLCSAFRFNDHTPTVAGAENGDFSRSSRRNRGYHTDTLTVDQEGRARTHTFRDNEKGNLSTNNEAFDAGCVIYVAQGNTFNYSKYRREASLALTKAGLDENAFEKVRPLFIEGYVMQKPLGTLANANVFTSLPTLGRMPMRYSDFMAEYINNRTGALHTQRERNYTRSGGKMQSVRCDWMNFNISAYMVSSLTDEGIAAELTFAQYGADELCVDVEVIDEGKTVLTFPQISRDQRRCQSGSCKYWLNAEQAKQIAEYVAQKQAADEQGESGKPVELTFKWTAYECGNKSRYAVDYTTYTSDAVAQQVARTADECKEGDEQKADPDADGCERVRKCVQKDVTVDGKQVKAWVYGDPEKVDPNCGQARKQHTFASFIREIRTYEGCDELLNSISNKQLVFADDDVKNVLIAAKTKYEQQNPGEELVYSDDCITIANLFDAMNILQNGIPLNAVCALGKSIGANSKDPHIKDAYAKDYNNMFGTFAAFMGVESAYFPTEYMIPANGDGARVDPRFYWCQGNKAAALFAEQNGVHADYHYGNYVWSSSHGPRPAFEQELNSGIWQGAPLKPIADAIGWTPKAVNNDADIKANRKSYHASHVAVFGNSTCDLKGSMSYENIAAYIRALCSKDGLKAKPSNHWTKCGPKGPGTGDHQTTGGSLPGTGDCAGKDC